MDQGGTWNEIFGHHKSAKNWAYLLKVKNWQKNEDISTLFNADSA